MADLESRSERNSIYRLSPHQELGNFCDGDSINFIDVLFCPVFDPISILVD